MSSAQPDYSVPLLRRNPRTWSGRPCLAAVACIAVNLWIAHTSANAATPVDEVRSALDQVHRWVDAGPHGQDWRAHLKSQQLQSQLAKGARADPAVVRQILDLYSSGAPGLELPEFLRVRQALSRWVDELAPPSIDQLPARVRAAKSRFAPVTKAELSKARSRLTAALGRLDARLREVGPDGNGWRPYLRLDVLQSQLARGDRADVAKLDEIYWKFHSGQEGLALVCFSDARRALRDYVAAANSLKQPKLKDHYGDLLDALEDHLKSVGKIPTAEQAAGIAEAIAWLRDARQADRLIREIYRCFDRPNLMVQVSSELVRAGIERPVDDTSPVEQVILGTDVRGTGRTTGQLEAKLVPNPRQAEIAVVFRGVAKTDTVGYNGPARIYSDGVTQLRARKSLRVDPDGVQAVPATAEAETSTTVAGIALSRGGRLAQRVAWKRVYRQKCAADRIAERRAEDRVNGRLNDEATESIEQSKDKPAGKFCTFLDHRAWLPTQLRLSTTRDAVHLVAVEADAAQLAAPVPPPPLAGKPDLGVCVHESMVNNWSARALSGVILTEEELQATSFDILGRHPEQLESDKDAEPWTVSFDYGQPIFVSFGNGEFTLSVRGRSYATGETVHPAMDVTARYRIAKTDQGLKAVRQGDLRVFPPGFVPDSGERLSLREQGIRDLLGRRFEKILPKQIIPKPLELPEPWDAAGDLVLSQWDTRDGWMVLGWNRTPPAKPAPSTGPAR